MLFFQYFIIVAVYTYDLANSVSLLD